MQRLGIAIRLRRQSAGYSQERFADRIGMHRSYYSAIERGEKNLQIDTLQRICDGLQMRVWEILQDAEEAPASASVQGDSSGAGSCGH